ncbi:putative quinol monooxygenase [Hoeflea prorocentri]|uniref:Antibiotic biosynthesis monooxygenase n=1 Tax=Hoeflea prorocentri TaxID=1922333 RepID=A0A9X3UIQ3_9HYPH|nr:antibiotic biosynthesis monooxygenase [Hoeflea prorocentri]MCY6382113.1 antibiotic biosynthesis monooxygenase [Hoeflea prorocentri]MDA5399913.1 antibiotic biosynthesis monooxygenase [Hoeflea prorocentri]
MSGEVSWVVSAAIKAGALEDLKALSAEMIENTQASEPGTLGYEWAISEDGARLEIHEHYRDSEAALTHLGTFNANYAKRLMALIDPPAMAVTGAPDAALKKVLTEIGATFMQPAGGFTR